MKKVMLIAIYVIASLSTYAQKRITVPNLGENALEGKNMRAAWAIISRFNLGPDFMKWHETIKISGPAYLKPFAAQVEETTKCKDTTALFAENSLLSEKQFTDLATLLVANQYDGKAGDLDPKKEVIFLVNTENSTHAVVGMHWGGCVWEQSSCQGVISFPEGTQVVSLQKEKWLFSGKK